MSDSTRNSSARNSAMSLADFRNALTAVLSISHHDVDIFLRTNPSPLDLAEVLGQPEAQIRLLLAAAIATTPSSAPMLQAAPPLLADDPQWLVALHYRNYKCAAVLGGTVEIHPARWLTTFTAVMADRGQPEALLGH